MGCQTSTVRDAKGSGKDELAVETEQEIRFNKRLTDKIKGERTLTRADAAAKCTCLNDATPAAAQTGG